MPEFNERSKLRPIKNLKLLMSYIHLFKTMLLGQSYFIDLITQNAHHNSM